MNQVRLITIALLLLSLFPLASGAAESQVADLRLVPFPKEVVLQPGQFSFGPPLVLEASSESLSVLKKLLWDELRRAGSDDLEARSAETFKHAFRLATVTGDMPQLRLAADAVPESYVLEIRPDAIVCRGVDAAGLLHGLQTLCQLIRANRIGKALPCLEVRDWPSMRWRCFQDDLTRGPSSTFHTLRQHIDLGAELKMNLFTYYMECQFAFQKHPVIGPENGSLQPEELARLVQYAKARQVDILGNQQSFGHFTNILKHPEFADLRETGYLLCPTNEKSYQLLDDLYSEVCPLLPFEMFNVCCDETAGLGSGPSKELAEQIGVGGVYVQHVRRLHDLLRDKYNKRMMMWGDIILQHPDKLDQIPKDTVMLTWGYSPQESFEDQIIPFKESGYEFFVCPGISNWSRILPDFAATTTNIRNFVRDGIQLGALGMLNTAWEDDGEALQGYKWHGYAWGAECAWSGSQTAAEDFNRRLGGVLFGEPGDHFGQAIELLSKTHALPGMKQMLNSRFWDNDFLPRQRSTATRNSAQRLLDIVRPAIKHLEACKQDAVVNAELLDACLNGARRMELIGQRMLDGLRACEAYAAACDATDRDQRLALVKAVQQLVDKNRRAYADLGQDFQRVWLSESKPYALDWTMKRYAEVDQWYGEMGDRVAQAVDLAEQGGELPHPTEIGLALPTSYSRQTRPHAVMSDTMQADLPWIVSTATHRLGIAVEAGNVARYELPIELDVALPSDLAAKPVQAFWVRPQRAPQEILVQLDPVTGADKQRITLMIPGPVEQGTLAMVHVYCGLTTPPKSLGSSAATAELQEGFWLLKNNLVTLRLGAEGAHIYSWGVNEASDRDLTMPGQTGWSGFADLSHHYRSAPNQVTCTAQGPALVRYACKDANGMEKVISLFGGASWVEVLLSEPVNYYWDFDNPTNFAADGPTPGTYRFSNGTTGPVGLEADAVAAQVKETRVRWAIKWNQDELALGVATPEVATQFVVAPGAGAGGVGIEGATPACHFVTFAGRLQQSAGETMQRLTNSLDFANQPKVFVYELERRR